jgi:hypothetical protein
MIDLMDTKYPTNKHKMGLLGLPRIIGSFRRVVDSGKWKKVKKRKEKISPLKFVIDMWIRHALFRMLYLLPKLKKNLRQQLGS